MLNTMSCVYCHFSTIFHCIMAVCFIDGGNETIRREPLTFLIGGKLYYIILYQVHLDRVRSLSGTCACNRHRFLENPEKINQWQVADILYFIKLYWVLFAISGIKVITKLPNSEQSYKGKVQTHNYINRQNQSTTGKLWKP